MVVGLRRMLSIPALAVRPSHERHTLPEQGGAMPKVQKITPFLWFDDQAEAAARFYVSIFGDSRVASVTRYDDEAAKAAGRPRGSVMTVAFELDGQGFTALN